ncbi:hypothetical protein [Hyphomonas sp.]|uniref:hypothetical protein n=1 Tax=Hyphomonas sp. TaxID=87 RepID=UPI00391B429F
MAMIILSHFSLDDALVSELETWLKANGFTDQFIDDAHIAGGQAGRKRVRQCRLVPGCVLPLTQPPEFRP